MTLKRQLILLLCAWNAGCVAAIDCDNVQYSENRIDDDEYIDKCIPEQWRGFLKNMKEKGTLEKLAFDLKTTGEDLKNGIESKMPWLFNALKLVTGPQDVKVVIVGQDPTPQPGKATGLAFSVENPRTVPAVLSVLLEVAFEGFAVDLDNGDLSSWAHQGVLLLNAALTVPQTGAEGLVNLKHPTLWKEFTSHLIKYISQTSDRSVWLLWGGEAKKLKSKIEEVKMDGKPKHLVIEGGHPSPVGFAMHGDSFFGGGYFLCANRFLSSHGRDEINWSLTDYRWKSLKPCLEQTEIEIEQNFKKRYEHKLQQIAGFAEYHKQELRKLELEHQNLLGQKQQLSLQQFEGREKFIFQKKAFHENQLSLLQQYENDFKQQASEEWKKAQQSGDLGLLQQIKQIKPFELQLLRRGANLPCQET